MLARTDAIIEGLDRVEQVLPGLELLVRSEPNLPNWMARIQQVIREEHLRAGGSGGEPPRIGKPESGAARF